MNQLIANILTFVADCFLVAAASQKTKKKTLVFQSVFVAIVTVCNAILGAWSGCVVDAMGLVRNIFVIKEKNTKIANIILYVLAIVLSLSVCESLWGLFPVAACIVENYYVLKPSDDIKTIKLALAFSCACWVVYNFVVGIYVGAIFNLIAVFTYLCYFIKKK